MSSTASRGVRHVQAMAGKTGGGEVQSPAVPMRRHEARLAPNRTGNGDARPERRLSLCRKRNVPLERSVGSRAYRLPW